MKRLLLAFLLCAVSVQAQTVLLTEDMVFPVSGQTGGYSFERAGKVKIFGREQGSGFWISNPYTRVGVNFNARLAGNARNECFQRDRLLLVGNNSLMLSKDKVDENFTVIIGESTSIDLWFPDACISLSSNGDWVGATNLIFTDFYIVALDSLPPEEPPIDPLAMRIEEIASWEIKFRMLADSVSMVGVDTFSVDSSNSYRLHFNQPLRRQKYSEQPNPVTYPLHPDGDIREFVLLNPPDSLTHQNDDSVGVAVFTGALNLQVGNWGVGIICIDLDGRQSKESNWFRFVTESDDPVNAPLVPVNILFEPEGQN